MLNCLCEKLDRVKEKRNHYTSSKLQILLEQEEYITLVKGNSIFVMQ